MTQDLKDQIMYAAKGYMKDKNLSQAALARLCGLNPSYLSNMINGVYEYKVSGDKTIEISDRHFVMLANSVGMSLKTLYWPMVATDQFAEIIHTLEVAKEHSTAKMIIGSTGCGKTYSVNTFCRENPLHVFRITVSSMSSVYDLIDELTEKVGITTTIRRQGKLLRLTKRIIELSDQGLKPMIIIDEGENMKIPVLGMCKAIYDAVVGYCGFVILGTPELTTKLEKLNKRSKEGVPQFCRRFKAGTIILKPIDRSYKEFINDKITDLELRRLLTSVCSNYGELHDYLEPALRAASEDGVPLTADYFKTMYAITTHVAF